MTGPRLIKATAFCRIPVQDPRRLAALGIRECSRMKFVGPIPAGADCYVCPLSGTALWMAYFEGGPVLKMTGQAATRYLVSERDARGRVVYDRDGGRGHALWAAQNRRAGDRPWHPSAPPRDLEDEGRDESYWWARAQEEGEVG